MHSEPATAGARRTGQQAFRARRDDGVIVSEQYDEQPVDQTADQPIEPSRPETDEVLTDPRDRRDRGEPGRGRSVEPARRTSTDLQRPVRADRRTADLTEADADRGAAPPTSRRRRSSVGPRRGCRRGADEEPRPTRPPPTSRRRAAVDPLEEFRTALREKEGDWFVVHTYSGMENRVKANLENRITSLNMEYYIHEVIVPTEEVAEIKNGQRKLVKRTVLPGYVLVRMDLTDESWSAVRHTPSVTGFVGHSHQPVPLSLEEVENMLAPAIQAEAEAAAAPESGGRRARQDAPRASRSPSPTSTSPTRSWWSTVRSPRCTRRSPRSTPRPEGQGPRRDLRPGDPGRAELHPDPEGLSRSELRGPSEKVEERQHPKRSEDA